jgi:AraC-like DNA-binding protein
MTPVPRQFTPDTDALAPRHRHYGHIYDQECIGPEAFIGCLNPSDPDYSGWAEDRRNFDMHVHHGMEIGIVLAGLWQLYFGDFELDCRPGDVWLCAMWEPHRMRMPASDAKHVVLVFPPDFMGEELTGSLSWLRMFAVPPEQRPCVAQPDTRRRVISIGTDMREEIAEARSPDWIEVVRLGIARVFIELGRNWTPPKQFAGQSGSGPRPSDLARIIPAVTLVHADPARPIKASEAAAACGVSVSRFQHVFRDTMGISFGRFGRRARLGLCAHRLLATDMPIDAVAAEAGLFDGSHLHRAFVSEYGCTPGEFREQGRMRRPST